MSRRRFMTRTRYMTYFVATALTYWAITAGYALQVNPVITDAWPGRWFWVVVYGGTAVVATDAARRAWRVQDLPPAGMWAGAILAALLSLRGFSSLWANGWNGFVGAVFLFWAAITLAVVAPALLDLIYLGDRQSKIEDQLGE